MQPGMPDLSQLLVQAQQMQEAVEHAQLELASAEYVGTAGGSLVSATVSGDGQLKDVTISPDAVDPDDLETLGDLIVAAVRDANRQAREQGEQLMVSATGGLDLGALGIGGPVVDSSGGLQGQLGPGA